MGGEIREAVVERSSMEEMRLTSHPSCHRESWKSYGRRELRKPVRDEKLFVLARVKKVKRNVGDRKGLAGPF